MIRRICVCAGPGAGKSVLASWLFSELSIADLRIQYVDEYIKLWACENRIPDDWDQLTFFQKQLEKEKSYLKSGKVDLIITDCPLFMVATYCIRTNNQIAEELISLAKKFDKDYPATYLFLDRTGIPYRSDGRFETFEQAVAMDILIREQMKIHLDRFMTVRTKDRAEILATILDHLEKS